MSFRSFLSEKQVGRVKELSEDDVVELLRGKAKNAYTVTKQAPLFADFDGPDLCLLDASEREPRSPFWLDGLLSEHRGWKKYPNRQKSLRAYTNVHRAGDDPAVVIPLDSHQIGVCSSYSFYRSFDKAQKSLGVSKLDNDGIAKWVVVLAEGLNAIGGKIGKEEPDDFKGLTSRLGEIDEFIQGEGITALTRKLREAKGELHAEVNKVVSDLFSRYVADVGAYLEEKLDPEDNGFQLLRVEAVYKFSGDREVWTSGPCLMMKRRKYLDLHKNGVVE